ncbi:glycosyltransferase [Actinotalea sp. Marseille-Q4924]|uniref:glycosyltransferase n=1 Tax=Actinotalea sp. Marseille-Q4924 TaxID=2866571 RepID=UPI001CE41668|nr:glycosyltransferase [Actinotalea sp. Marseille-Q4924]
MRLVFAAIPAFGHLYPLMPLALACADAGHDVTVAAGPPFLGRLPLPTILQQPPGLDLEATMAETQRRNPHLHGGELMVGLFADVTAEAVVETLLPALEASPPDLIVYEAMDAGVGVVADLLGVPAVAYAISLVQDGPAAVHPATVRYRQEAWRRRGRRPPEDVVLLGRGLLDHTPPSLRGLGAALDATRFPVRPVPYAEGSATVPAWMTAPASRPRVYLTLGTVSFGAVDVLRRAVQEISSLDVDLLVVVGPEGDPAALGAVPANVQVERFVDQAGVLARVDLLVHHGGTGSVLGALANGLPQLVMPQGADQYANAAALSEVGAARALVEPYPESGAIRREVEHLLSGTAERGRARELQAEIAALPEPADVVDQLVALAADG